MRGQLDEVLEALGPWGRFNLRSYALLLVPVLLAGVFGPIFVFEASDIPYRCEVPVCEGENDTAWEQFALPPQAWEGRARCLRYASVNPALEHICHSTYFSNITEPCSNVVYSNEDSAVKDFRLGCSEWKRTLVGTVHNAGLFVSLPLTGVLSDRYGRRVALACASLANGVCGLLRSFSTSYSMLLAFEFLEAALGAGAYTSAFVLAMELVGPKGRVFGNTVLNATHVVGQISLAGLSWWLQSWRTVLRIVYTPAVLVFSYLWLLDESTRWLLSKGRIDEANAILQKAAKMNKVNLGAIELIPLNAKQDPEDIKDKKIMEEKPKEVSTFKAVISSSVIRARLAICSFLWITCTFVFYGLSINSVSLVGTKYTNFMLVAFVEIPANLACLAVLDRLGRKRTLVPAYMLSALFCVSLAFLPRQGWRWVTLTVYVSGKFFITLAYSSVYIYVSEVFPTSARQSLLAVCSTTGRFGSALAPMTPLLAQYYSKLPSLVFSALALCAAALVPLLPETLHKPLPDTVAEAEQLARNPRNPRNPRTHPHTAPEES